MDTFLTQMFPLLHGGPKKELAAYLASFASLSPPRIELNSFVVAAASRVPRLADPEPGRLRVHVELEPHVAQDALQLVGRTVLKHCKNRQNCRLGIVKRARKPIRLFNRQIIQIGATSTRPINKSGQIALNLRNRCPRFGPAVGIKGAWHSGDT